MWFAFTFTCIEEEGGLVKLLLAINSLSALAAHYRSIQPCMSIELNLCFDTAA